MKSDQSLFLGHSFNKMASFYLRSDPKVRSKALVMHCSFCWEKDHSKRICRKKFQDPLKHDDALEESFFT